MLLHLMVDETARLRRSTGRLLEACGDAGPRQMMISPRGPDGRSAGRQNSAYRPVIPSRRWLCESGAAALLFGPGDIKTTVESSRKLTKTSLQVQL